MKRIDRLNQIEKCFENIKANSKPQEQKYYGESFFSYSEEDIKMEFCNLDNNYDKITLAQIANHPFYAKELVNNLKMSIFQNVRLNALKKINKDIFFTLNYELLEDKYKFLWDDMPLLSIDQKVQAQIVSLDDNRLSWFKDLYKKVKEIGGAYPVKYISNILNSIGCCPFVKDVEEKDYLSSRYQKASSLCSLLDTFSELHLTLSDEQLTSLLFLLGTNAGVDLSCQIKKIEDLNNLLAKDNPIQKYLSSIIEEEMAKSKEERNSRRIKDAIFKKYFGLNFGNAMDSDAPALTNKFHLEGLKRTPENSYLLNLCDSLQLLSETNDSDKLLNLCDILETSGFEQNLTYMTTFESSMREEYAKQINEVLLSTEKLPKKKIGNAIVYDAGTDFKMLVTAVGSYQNITRVGNYREYWNSPQIRSHGNCCSLISNSNLATARQTSVVFGFKDMPTESLLAGNLRDANSTPHNMNYDINYHNKTQNYYSPTELINHTRDYYNELNYERMDTSKKGKYFKKNPDYIVFFEEFEDINKELKSQHSLQSKQQENLQKNKKNKSSTKSNNTTQEQSPLAQTTFGELTNISNDEKRRWDESVRASIQFGIPIVKINRETCAKSEKAKIDELLNLLECTEEPSIINRIITKFANNYTGLRDMTNSHRLLRKRYFSQNDFSTLINSILHIIKNCDDSRTRKEMFDSLESAICNEGDLNYHDSIKYVVSYDDGTLDRLFDIESQFS
jgi:hypothetical protein